MKYLTEVEQIERLKSFNELLETEYDPIKDVDKDDGFYNRSLIENCLKPILRDINNNRNISTFTSTKRKGIDGKTSYLGFLYSKEVESEIKENLIPFFESKFNIAELPEPYGGNGAEFFSTFGETEMGFARIKLTLKSQSKEMHDQFWEEIKIRLTDLKPKGR